MLTENRVALSRSSSQQRFRKRFDGMRVLGINAVFHDPAAALVVDGEVLSAAEEERFQPPQHGKDPAPFSTWSCSSRRRAGACGTPV